MTVGIKGAILLRDLLQKRLGPGVKFFSEQSKAVLKSLGKVMLACPLKHAAWHQLFGAVQDVSCYKAHCAPAIVWGMVQSVYHPLWPAGISNRTGCAAGLSLDRYISGIDT